MKKKSWNELTDTQKTVLLTLMSVQVSLAVSAWADLAFRPAEQGRGSKGRWAAIIAVNFIGPALYFWRGRQK